MCISDGVVGVGSGQQVAKSSSSIMESH
jgi:hypothetical protein